MNERTIGLAIAGIAATLVGLALIADQASRMQETVGWMLGGIGVLLIAATAVIWTVTPPDGPGTSDRPDRADPT